MVSLYIIYMAALQGTRVHYIIDSNLLKAYTHHSTDVWN